MKYVIGIDGGGTSTKATLYEVEGKQLGSALDQLRVGPSNLNSVPEAEVREAFRLIHERLYRPTVLATGLGVAGISKTGVRERLARMLAELGFEEPCHIVGDQEAALAAALGDEGGVLLVSGTGSIAMAALEDGQTKRTGGFGHLLDDRGSAYAVGQAILTSYLQAYDGRLPFTKLHHLVEKRIAASGDDAVRSILELAYATHFDKSKIASFAPLLTEAIAAEDPQALSIAEKELDALVALVLPFASYFKAVEVPLVLAGGMLSPESEYRKLFVARLNEYEQAYKVVEPKADAMHGAAQLALKQLRL